MKSDPYQERSTDARAAKRALIKRLTDTAKAMREAEGQERRRLEERRGWPSLTGEADKDKRYP